MGNYLIYTAQYFKNKIFLKFPEALILNVEMISSLISFLKKKIKIKMTKPTDSVPYSFKLVGLSLANQGNAKITEAN